jgi:DNA-binding transcriptional LysR family regulator
MARLRPPSTSQFSGTIKHSFMTQLHRLEGFYWTAQAGGFARAQVEEVSLGDPRRVLSGETDLLIEYQPDLPTGLQARRVGSYYAFLIAPRGRIAANATTRAAAKAVRELPFVGFHSAMPQHLVQREGLRQLGLGDTPQVLGASSTEALLAFVREGLGFSLVPWPDERGPLEKRVDAWRMRGPGTEFSVVATYRAKPPDPLVSAALDALV